MTRRPTHGRRAAPRTAAATVRDVLGALAGRGPGRHALTGPKEARG